MEEQYQEGVTGSEATHNESQKGKQSKLNFFATWILHGLIFILPLFALPFGVSALDFNKAMLLYTGVLTAFLLFFLARLRKGSTIFVKSMLLASLFSVAGIWLLSALFSANRALSLWGAGYESGTFLFFFILAIVAFLIAVLFRTEEHILLSYILLFASATILFCVQILHTGFGIAIPPWAMFNGRLANLAGDWNDLGIFFGLIAILSLVLLEFANTINTAKKARVFLYGVLVMSLTVVLFVDFSTLWIVLGVAVLALFSYHFATFPRNEGQPLIIVRNFLRPTSFVFLGILFFGLASGWTGSIINYFGLQSTYVRPSWGSTLGIVRGSLNANILVGSGPNTFMYDWLVLKPNEIANTIFWDASFQSGIGRLPSMIAETGLLGGIAIAFLIFMLLYSLKSVLSYKEQNTKRVLLASSFLCSIYLWIFVIIYSPGFLILTLAGIFTGIFLASMIIAGKLTVAEFVFPPKNTKKGIIARFVALAIMLVSLYGIYALVTRHIAGYFYTSAVQEVSIRGDIDKADIYLERAVWLDPQDVYFRSAAELGLLRLRQIVAQTSKSDTVSSADKAQFQSVLEKTVQSAKNAVSANSIDSQNWSELGRVYEAILPFDPKGLKESAIISYQEVMRRSPHDPSPLVALARIELQLKNFDDALKYLKESIKIKSDFTMSHLMIAQVDAEQGRMKDAISELESTVIANPDNSDNVYIVLQIGILYYQDKDYEKAQGIFEKLVEVNKNYADARYALGLLYDKKGMFAQATAQFEELNKLIPDNTEIQKILNNLKSGRGALGEDLTPPAPQEEITKTPVKSATKKK